MGRQERGRGTKRGSCKQEGGHVRILGKCEHAGAQQERRGVNSQEGHEQLIEKAMDRSEGF